METSTPLLTNILEIHNLSSGACRALLGLLSFRNKTTGQCCPRIATLAQRLGTPRRTLCRWLCELRVTGVVVPTRHRGSNSYTITIPTNCGKPSVDSCGDMPKVAHPDMPKVAHLDVPKMAHLGRSILIEQTVLNRQDGTAAAVKLRNSVAVPVKKAAAALSSALQKTTKPKPEQLALDLQAQAQVQPTASLPDSAEALTRALVNTHPQPGLPRKAVGEVRKALASGWSADAIRERHAEWCVYWATVPPGKFIPMLWRWFDSGDFESKPVVRKPPVVENYVERFRRQLREA